MRRLLVVLLGALAALLVAGPVRAHVGGGAAGSDYDGRVLAVTPEMPGVDVRVLSFGDEFELVNGTNTDVLVPGYSEEPYLRIGPEGVWRNANSPATYINLDRFGRVTLPRNADPSAEPDWEQVSTQPEYVWHDHRTHWMSEGQLPPAVAADPTRTHRVFQWEIPMVHGGDEVTVAGELTWSPPPSPAVIWPVYALLALAGVLAGALGRSPRPLGGLLVVGAAAALWHAAATPAPPASLGTHTGAVVSALLPVVFVLAVAVLGARAALRGHGVMTGLMAVLMGWLLLIQGLPDVDVLWTANVLSNGPQWLARSAVAVLVALGAGLVVGGVVAARRYRDPARTDPLPDGAGPLPVG
ncbi:hypothetical protein ACI797_19260 [Geodermatophilus sp. SYSU D00691]